MEYEKEKNRVVENLMGYKYQGDMKRKIRMLLE